MWDEGVEQSVRSRRDMHEQCKRGIEDREPDEESFD